MRPHFSATLLLLATTLMGGGCRAQTASSAGGSLPPELARRIALMIRNKASLPFQYDVKVGDRKPSVIDGYDEITVLISEGGKPAHPMSFLISKDNQKLAQLNQFDLSKDPKSLVSDAGRPARGGSEKAPVTIVVYDDLECPFCAKMHTQMFPAIEKRYGKNVRIAYKDFPLTQIHPWAIHAAVNAECLAAQSATAYWNYVDYTHAHLNEMGVEPGAKDKDAPPTLPVATRQLDTEAKEEGARHKVDAKKLAACIERQDETAVKAFMGEGDALNVTGVPALFINGEMITGAVPIEYVYRAVDDALLAQGVTPPPAVPLPSLEAPASAAPAADK